MNKANFLQLFTSIATLALLFTTILLGAYTVIRIVQIRYIYAVEIECDEDQLPLDGECYDPDDNGKFDWCHVEPNENSQTLNLPAQALVGGGHVDAEGNILHNGDHIGACTGEEPVFGCTDDTALNFNSEATEDDGSCEYENGEGCDEGQIFDPETEQCVPEESPIPTPTTDVCANIDGDQVSVPDGLHLDASGLNCVAFQLGGPPPPPPAQPQPQVLGATTMAQTGTAEENIFLALFALGSILAGTGVRKLATSKK